MRIGIDIMGGDFAPKATVLGAILAYKELPSDCRIVLIGDQQAALAILAEEGISADNFDIIHTEEVIEMGEHPAKALTQKQKNVFLKLKINKSLPANKILGIEEIKKYLDKKIPLEQAFEETFIRTRRYVKRQRTWFRGHMKDWTSIFDPNFDILTKKIINLVTSS